MKVAVQVSGDLLTDPTYRCEISDGLAQTLASNARLDIKTYLHYV